MQEVAMEQVCANLFDSGGGAGVLRGTESDSQDSTQSADK